MVLSCAPAAAARSSFGTFFTPTDGALHIKALSNRADLVSGGDALVQIAPPAGVDPAAVRADLDGRDVTGAFAVRDDGHFYGLLDGLRDGDNVLTAKLPDGSGARLTITNHPIGGPVFAGPQVQPWICTNADQGLGAPTDAKCDTPPVFSYSYKDATTGQFSDYDPKSPPPAGQVATTTTDDGRTVPYIVRTERGVIDRGVYQVAALDDPAKPWTAWDPQPGWDHKLLVVMGAGCETGHVMLAPQDVIDDGALSRGYAVITTEMDDNTQDCNDVVQAEALMMLEEHVIESYGAVRYAVGQGCSGGSMAQYSIAANYPGLLDAIQPTCSFPDIWTTYREMADCKLLARYFDQTSPQEWTEPQRAAASGNESLGTCEFQNTLRSDSYVSATGPQATDALDAKMGCRGHDWTYDPKTNRGGVRCGIQDYEVAVFGTRAKDGFANRAWDNVGVQYGLKALQDGTIAPEQFVDLNEKVGGLDIDGVPQPQRTEADAPAIATAYRTGRINSGRELARVPIMDLRGTSNNEEHFDFHTYEMRARLDRDNGTHANQVFWNSACTLTPCPPVAQDSFDLIDRWTHAIEADDGDAPLQRKVLEDRPEDAVDACYLPERRVNDMTVCRAALPYYSDPRSVAGGPTTGDVIKCRLKPLDKAAYARYGVTFSDDQWARLRKAFPTGVCDYAKPGVDQQSPAGAWESFSGGPGGVPLGAAPSSQQLVQCADRRSFTFHIHRPRRGRIVSVTAYVNGRRVKRVRGRRVTRLTLPRLPQGVFTVKIVATSDRHVRRITVRRYRGCTKSAPVTRVRRPARRKRHKS